MPFFKRNKATDRPPAPFVVGMNRSGTTLVRMMLDSHPELTIPPETHFVPDVIRACRRRSGTPEAALGAMKGHREWNFTRTYGLPWRRRWSTPLPEQIFGSIS